MKTPASLHLLAFCALFVSCNTEKKEIKTEEVKVPVAEKSAKELSGNRIDNYYWMKLSDEQKNATQKDEQTQKVISYLDAENEYLKTKTRHTEELQRNCRPHQTNR
jgi:oligopeptidase B